MTAQLRIPVGVVVARRQAASPWVDVVWRPVAALAGPTDASPWSLLAENDKSATYYAGAAEIVLYRSDTGSYRDNLASGMPSLWIAMHQADGDPPFVIAGVTADPTEGEAWTEPAQAIVEAVPMPETVWKEVAAFIERHPPAPGFVKRQRDRADPEALGRRVPPVKGQQ